MSSTNGIVKNFTWKLTGINADALGVAHYGGTLGASITGTNPPTGAILQFNLTPVGNLIDGSQGQPLTLKKTLQGETSFQFTDIPVGEYTLTATETGSDGTVKNIPTELVGNIGAYTNTTDLTFQPGLNQVMGDPPSAIINLQTS
ncbi:hypothetical protein KDH_31940 [Dictyobacter sp. S3.2.2.5]|uniref:Bacterial Ig-like domain-containing protein n=2 Tax=Dictyobacter halimunensis TaxID=3026934 RepID=A0ABQ6FSU0_9CHLR|nr:hypothetical protein KDH_31940 [Dictyobacter sp. S3.2.2.5]